MSDTDHLVELSSEEQPSQSSTTGGTLGLSGMQLKARFPARPLETSWPETRLDSLAVIARVLDAPFRLENSSSQKPRSRGVVAILGWLATFPGDTWQDRWLTGGAEASIDWRELLKNATIPGQDKPPPYLSVNSGLLVLICADVIRPHLDWLLQFAAVRRNLGIEMARTRDPEAFAAMGRTCATEQVGLQPGQLALTQIAAIMAAKGGLVVDVEVGDCVQVLEGVSSLPRSWHGYSRSPLFYQLLRWHRVLGEEAPAALEMFTGSGQPTCEQLIDRYNIRCRPARDLLIDYLSECQMAMDFSTLQRMSYLVGKLFWADLEEHHPGIDSLKIPAEIASSWKQRVVKRTFTSTTGSGEKVQKTLERLDARSVFSAVRVFYLDLAEWVEEDPARWGPWAVRCPVNARDVSHKKSRLARKSRMDQRTRERLPVLPALVS
ncbi:hypothetical protein ACTXJU_08905 [Glutamicibacter ardleyensis]|uniref:hypothetical protein n=1 Tax=Glutamicibacter ardleyensis TaxID=225894 RepID=UPI003FD54E25